MTKDFFEDKKTLSLCLFEKIKHGARYSIVPQTRDCTLSTTNNDCVTSDLGDPKRLQLVTFNVKDSRRTSSLGKLFWESQAYPSHSFVVCLAVNFPEGTSQAEVCVL